MNNTSRFRIRDITSPTEDNGAPAFDVTFDDNMTGKLRYFETIFDTPEAASEWIYAEGQYLGQRDIAWWDTVCRLEHAEKTRAAPGGWTWVPVVAPPQDGMEAMLSAGELAMLRAGAKPNVSFEVANALR